MALLTDDEQISARKLLITGVPSFIAAMAFSLLTHHLAHRLGDAAFCGAAAAGSHGDLTIVRSGPPADTCAMAALYGQVWTLGLALAAFALMLRYPGNLFLGSTAFINATARIPETATMFLQYLIHSRSWVRSEESLTLTLLGNADPTIPMAILCAMTILLVSFSIIIVHDLRSVRYKWAIAAVLFAGMGFIESGVVILLRPALGG